MSFTSKPDISGMAGTMSSRRRLLDAATQARAGRARALVLTSGVALFALAFGLTKASHPSNAKHALTRLDPPPTFVNQLQADELRAGVVAAPQAPPEAQTAAS
jgi:hypothetical protein